MLQYKDQAKTELTSHKQCNHANKGISFNAFGGLSLRQVKPVKEGCNVESTYETFFETLWVKAHPVRRDLPPEVSLAWCSV